ncbi:MAG: hypothetical protein ACRDRS_20820 [Pseudonocardiaceae bacterium]
MSARFGLELPAGAQSIKSSAWLSDGDPASRDPVDSHVGYPGEFADGDAEIDLSTSALGVKQLRRRGDRRATALST